MMILKREGKSNEVHSPVKLPLSEWKQWNRKWKILSSPEQQISSAGAGDRARPMLIPTEEIIY